jgi:hypothetical protein
MLPRIRTAWPQVGTIESEGEWTEFCRKLLRESDSHFGSDRAVLDAVWDETCATSSILTCDSFLARLFQLHPPPLDRELSVSVDALSTATRGLAALIRASAAVDPATIDGAAMKSMARAMRSVRTLESKVCRIEVSVNYLFISCV